jgi:hypothetical protein
VSCSICGRWCIFAPTRDLVIMKQRRQLRHAQINKA